MPSRRWVRLYPGPGLNALLATLTKTIPTTVTAPLVVAQRLRKGSCNSARGARRLVGDAVKTARRMLGQGNLILVRMNSAFYGRGPVLAALYARSPTRNTTAECVSLASAYGVHTASGWPASTSLLHRAVTTHPLAPAGGDVPASRIAAAATRTCSSVLL